MLISAVSNAFETIDNEMICFIIFCLNCIRHGRNATYELGPNNSKTVCFYYIFVFKDKNLKLHHAKYKESNTLGLQYVHVGLADVHSKHFKKMPESEESEE